MDNIYTCTGHPLESDIENIVSWMLNDEFKTAYEKIFELKTLKGLALQDILEDTHHYIQKIDFPAMCRIFLLEKMAAIEDRLTAGVNEKLQLSALIGAFKRVTAIAEHSMDTSEK